MTLIHYIAIAAALVVSGCVPQSTGGWGGGKASGDAGLETGEGERTGTRGEEQGTGLGGIGTERPSQGANASAENPHDHEHEGVAAEGEGHDDKGHGDKEHDHKGEGHDHEGERHEGDGGVERPEDHDHEHEHEGDDHEDRGDEGESDAGVGGRDGGVPANCDDQLPRGSLEPGQREPASYIVSMSLPWNRNQAAELGCDLVGGNRGAGFSGLLELLRVERRNIRIADRGAGTDYFHLPNWTPGASLADARLRLNYENGTLIGVGGMVEREREVADLVNVRFRCPTLTADFEDPFPIFTEDGRTPFTFRIERAKISMEIRPDRNGFNSVGTITGYTTRTGLLRTIAETQQRCADAESEDSGLCLTLGPFLRGAPEEVLRRILPNLGGFDARITGAGSPTAECGEDCDAISVCAAFRGEPTAKIYAQ